jgi:hypothetical protein
VLSLKKLLFKNPFRIAIMQSLYFSKNTFCVLSNRLTSTTHSYSTVSRSQTKFSEPSIANISCEVISNSRSLDPSLRYVLSLWWIFDSPKYFQATFSMYFSYFALKIDFYLFIDQIYRFYGLGGQPLVQNGYVEEVVVAVELGHETVQVT